MVRTRFGEAPFDKVLLVKFSISNIKDREDAAFIQYNLLLRDEILQGHVDFSSKKASIVVLPGKNVEEILREEGIKYWIDSKETLSYEELIENNNQFQ